MHKSLVPVARTAHVAYAAGFNDLENGKDVYLEYAGYGKVADIATQAMLSSRPEADALERAIVQLKLERDQNVELTAYTAPLEWGISQLETLLSASPSRPLASL